MKGGGKFSEQR